MRYTESFQHLHRLSYVIGGLKQDVQYRRVAIYIGRIFMAECCTPEREMNDPHMPLRKDRMEWVARLQGHKEPMLDHVIKVSDYEWSLIQRAMAQYADESKWDAVWMSRRHAWIVQLDTLRAFN
jgi:hypothetical protein